MKAEKMFKELGWNKIRVLVGFQYRLNDDGITFDLMNKEISYIHDKGEKEYTMFTFNKPLLKAIRKQIKELKKSGEWSLSEEED